MKRIYKIVIVSVLLTVLLGTIILETVLFVKKIGSLEESFLIQLEEAERRIEKADNLAKDADAHAKEADAHAKEADAHAKEADELAKDAEKRASEAEERAIAAENLAKFLETYDKNSENIFSEECRVLMGDPLSPWLEGRMGCKLPLKTRTLDVEIKDSDNYAYFITGYDDPAYLNCVYDSGWLRGSSIITLDPELYYVFVSSVALSDEKPAPTESDLENHKLTVYRYYVDAIYQSSMMPSEYYFEDGYMQSKVEYIRELLKSTSVNGDAFMFITDEHWELNAKQSPKLANYLVETTGINKIFSGGDRVDNGYDIAVAREFRNALGNDNYFPVAGNHDFGEGGDESLLYASSFLHLSSQGNISWGEDGSLYYYVDDTAKKIRYVVLQAFEPNESDEGLNVAIEYSDAQIEWFKNIALDVEEGYTILIFSHVLLYGDDYTKEFAIPTVYKGYTEIYDAIADYNGRGEIAAVLQGHFHWDASTEIYKRRMLSKSYNEEAAKLISAIPDDVEHIYISLSKVEDLFYRVIGYSREDDSIAYDSGPLDSLQKIDIEDLSLRYEVIFEKIDGTQLDAEEIEACRVYEVTGKIPLVVTACDRYAAEATPTFDQSERVYGTITEQAFDVVILDKSEKKLYFVRIGALAKNNDGSLAEVREFYYG